MRLDKITETYNKNVDPQDFILPLLLLEYTIRQKFLVS